MNLKFSFIENQIEFSHEYIRCIEIENKKYFYRVIDILNNYAKGIVFEDLVLKDNTKIKIYIDYFNLDFDNKKLVNSINKIIAESISEENKNTLINTYKKLIKQYNIILNDIDIPLDINQELNINDLSKIFKVEVKVDNDLLKNIMTLIDVYKETKDTDIIFFVNLKEYLNSEELKEIYKYAIYNNVIISLIDSKSYGVCQEFEKKIIIDDNLEEYVL